MLEESKIQKGFGVYTFLSIEPSDHQQLCSLPSGSFSPDDGTDNFVHTLLFKTPIYGSELS
jgi:hypothetical protein